MGIKMTGVGDGRKISFSCDHPGCSAKTIRKVVVYQYDRCTGYTSKHVRDPRYPLPYWRKVLEEKFFLVGYDWPDGIVVRCAEHQAVRRRPGKLSAQKEKEVQAYMDRRKDLYD